MERLINAILGLDAGTRKRAIASIVMYVVNVLTIFGGITISDAKVTLIIEGLVAAATFIVWLIGFYFNENYTPEGCEGTGYTRAKKAGLEDGDEQILDDLGDLGAPIDNDGDDPDEL